MMESILGRLLNGSCDPLAVLRAKDKRSQNEQIQRALQKGEAIVLSG